MQHIESECTTQCYIRSTHQHFWPCITCQQLIVTMLSFKLSNKHWIC